MKVRILAVLAIIIAGLAVIGLNISNSASAESSYAAYIAEARESAEKELPYIAVQRYKSAFAVKCTDEAVYQEYIEQCRLLGDTFYETAVKNYVSCFPESAQAYEYLCKYYYDQESYSSLLSTAVTAKELGIATETVRDYYLEYYYMYKYIKTGLEEAGTFLGDYALVKQNGLYGYLKSSGSYLIAPMYENAVPLLNGYTAVYCDDEWCMINSSGFKVARADVPLDFLSFRSNEKVLLAVNGKYGYTNTSLTVPENLEYDYASNFKNGVAAVMKNGTWALIGSDGSAITDYIYEDIILDEYNTCINNGIIFAKQNGQYYMVDSSGTVVSPSGFDDAYPFVDTGAAAVCVDGKWGFADNQGNMMIEPQYDDAKSFSIGLAAVCVDGMWGYINSSNEYRISSRFTGCKPFASNGIAAVQENGVWNYIELYGYYYA